MVAPIAPATPPANNAAVVLDAQIERYKKELSDQVNSGAANTAEGQAAIDAIVDKIHAARESLAKAAEAKASRSDALPPTTNYSMLGNRLDKFA